MSFLWPEMLWLLLALPLLVAAYLLVLRRKKKFALRYASLDDVAIWAVLALVLLGVASRLTRGLALELGRRREQGLRCRGWRDRLPARSGDGAPGPRRDARIG